LVATVFRRINSEADSTHNIEPAVTKDQSTRLNHGSGGLFKPARRLIRGVLTVGNCFANMGFYYLRRVCRAWSGLINFNENTNSPKR